MLRIVECWVSPQLHAKFLQSFRRSSQLFWQRNPCFFKRESSRVAIPGMVRDSYGNNLSRKRDLTTSKANMPSTVLSLPSKSFILWNSLHITGIFIETDTLVFVETDKVAYSEGDRSSDSSVNTSTSSGESGWGALRDVTNTTVMCSFVFMMRFIFSYALFLLVGISCNSPHGLTTPCASLNF